MSGNLPQTNGSSSSPTYEQELEIKRVGYMRELAENYMEAVEEVVRDTQLDVSYALLIYYCRRHVLWRDICAQLSEIRVLRKILLTA